MEDESSNLSTFDIYSDLLLEQHQTPSKHVSVEQLEKTNIEYKDKLKDLTQQLENLQTQNAAILEENKILKTNISQLFKTAQAELQRKDRLLGDRGNRNARSQQEIDYRSSINDRLRDLRKYPRSYPRCTNGIEQDFSRNVSDNQDGALCRSNDAVQNRATSWMDGRSHQLASETSADIDAKKIDTGEKTGDSHDNQSIPIKTNLAKYDEQVRTHVDSQSKNDASCNKQTETIDQEEMETRKCVGIYVIPKKSTISHGSSVLGQKESEQGRSQERDVSQCRTRDSKRTDHRSTHSPSRYERETNARQSKFSHSRRQGQSSQSQSKSRERRSQRSDRCAVRPGLEQCSRRKRRHSSEGSASGCNTFHSNAPYKKHRGEFIAKSNDKRHMDSFPEKHRLQKHTKDGSPGKKELTRVHDERRARSKTSSHQNPNNKAANSAEVDERTRKRHQSDRNKKSLKRAKETLHRLHSTPKKQTSHEKSECKECKHRKCQCSDRDKRKADDCRAFSINRTSRTKKVIKDLEEGEMSESDFEDTSAGLATETRQDFTDQERQDQPAEACLSDSVGSTKAQLSKETSERLSCNIESSTCSVIPKISHKRQNKKTLEEFVPNATSGDKSVKAEPSHFSETARKLTSVTSCDNFNRVACLNDGECYKHRITAKTVGLRSVDDTVLEGAEIQPKELVYPRQPDSSSCGYSSEHKSILVYASSQDSDSGSESNTESNLSSNSMSATTCPDAIFQNEAAKYWMEEEGGALILQGQHPSSEEDLVNMDRGSLIIDTTDNQSQDENFIIKSKQKQREIVGSQNETEQTIPTSTSQDSAVTVPCALLKPILSPIGNTTDSFSERILEVFGSNSFLESDKEGSREGQSSLKTLETSSCQLEYSKLSTQGFTAGVLEGSVCSTKQHNNQVSFSKSRLGIISSTSTLPVSSGTVNSTESNSTSTEMPSNSAEDIAKEKTGDGNSDISNILTKEHLSLDLLSSLEQSKLTVTDSEHQDDFSNSQTDTNVEKHSLECTTHSVHPSPTASINKCAPCQSEAIEQTIAKCDVISDKNTKSQIETASANSSASQRCLFEAGNVADVSINPPSLDALSFSASPVHDSLLGDSDNSCLSDYGEEGEYETDNVPGGSENRDQDDQCNQETCSETANKQEHGQASVSTHLSDGEIISDSDSGDAPELKTPTQKSRGGDWKTKQERFESSQKRSRSRERKRHRSRDKQASSHKDRSQPTKHGRDKHGEVRDRAKFFEKKMHILERRLRAQDEAAQQSGYPRSRDSRDRAQDLHSVSRSRVGSRDEHHEKKLRSIVHKEMRGVDTDQRWRVDRPGEDKRCSSRHMGKLYSDTKHDNDKRERRKVEAKKRSKRIDYKK